MKFTHGGKVFELSVSATPGRAKFTITLLDGEGTAEMKLNEALDLFCCFIDWVTGEEGGLYCDGARPNEVVRVRSQDSTHSLCIERVVGPIRPLFSLDEAVSVWQEALEFMSKEL